MKNTEIRRRTIIQDIKETFTKLKWLFAGNVARLKSDRWTKILLEWKRQVDAGHQHAGQGRKEDR